VRFVPEESERTLVHQDGDLEEEAGSVQKEEERDSTLSPDKSVSDEMGS